MKAESESFLTIKYTRKNVSYLQCRKKNWEKFFLHVEALDPYLTTFHLSHWVNVHPLRMLMNQRILVIVLMP